MLENKISKISVETDEENILKEKLEISNILGGVATTFENEELPKTDNENYVKIYSGKALDTEGLFHFSACEDMKLILVAGPFSSGKTTLQLMFYYLFLEGHNKRLNFNGSVTIEGFKERSSKILCNSGESEPIVERTSRAIIRYLHLAVCDEEGRKKNLIFSDISGEAFSEPMLLEDMADLFSDSEDVILVADGEKLCDDYEKNNVFLDIILLMKRLLHIGIITKRTRLQIICTKQDKIDCNENSDSIKQFIQSNYKRLITQFDKDVYSINLEYVAALNIEVEENSIQLENIILRCMEDESKSNNTVPILKNDLIRHFDMYKMRG